MSFISANRRNAAGHWARWTLVLGLLVVSGCGDSPEPKRANSHLALERPNRLHIIPLDPCSYHRLQAGGIDFASAMGVLETSDDVRFQKLSWRVNGNEVHRGMFLESSHFKRDNIVELAHLDEDGTTVLESVQVTILNSAPRITGATLAPARNEGNFLECHIASIDPDNEPLSYEYEWKLDGARFAGAQGQRVSLRDLRKGQKISVTIRAFDGATYSQPFTPREFVINNLPPTIGEVSEATVRSMEDGTRIFRLHLEIKDPDGDELEVAFHGAPPSHNWNPESGILQWVFSGRAAPHTIQVRVSDGRGAVVQHQLDIAGEAEESR